MSDSKFYLVEERGFLGRKQISKTAGDPIVKSVNGGTRKIIRKQEITRDEFLKVSLNKLIDLYWSKEDEANV